MKIGTSLSAKSIYQSLGEHFSRFPDFRDSEKVKIKLEDFLMSGMAIFELKYPSLLKFDQDRVDPFVAANLKNLFGINKVPCDTHLREVLDEVSPSQFRPVFNSLFQRAQRSKVLSKFQIWEDYYLLAIDGSGYFSSNFVHCDQCLTRKHKASGETTYHHQMLSAAFVHPDQETVIPVCPEPIQNGDGHTKNDCEQNALKRFLVKFREDHPKLKVIVLMDALHATQPVLELIKKLQMSFLISVKPGSHDKLFEGVQRREELSQVQHFCYEEEIGQKVKKQRYHQYRYTNSILLNHQSAHNSVNFLEYWETTQWVNKRGDLQTDTVHLSWVTDFTLHESTIRLLTRAARTRWCIENETFNTLKNQGYEFEHNFGHGYKNLSVNFSHLMMLTFFVDQLTQLGCPLFQAALTKLSQRCRLWDRFKGIAFFPVVYQSWEEFFTGIIDREKQWCQSA